jgi:hypothetical protein
MKRYRILREDEYVRRGDQVRLSDEWRPTAYTLSDLVRAGCGKNYRRPLRKAERRSTSGKRTEYAKWGG